MDNAKQIKKIVEDFFAKLDPEASIRVLPSTGENIPVQAMVLESQTLIGANGETLFEIQHLLNIIVKRAGGTLYVDLDINGYKKKKIDYLRQAARSAADEASLSRRQQALAPMTPYERRIVHLELAERADVVTESVGIGSGRKVVVKPASAR